MGGSSDKKKSKKSKRSKRMKASKQAEMSADARLSEDEPEGEPSDGGLDLSEGNQLLVIELQRTELSRLLREQERLNDRVDQLLQLHEREQVLRQQMQASLDKLAAQRALPSPDRDEAEQNGLLERVNQAEGKFAALQSAVGMLVTALERRTASA